MRIENSEKLLKRLGERIRQARQDAGLRQEDFEDTSELYLAARSLQEIEYGNANPRIYTLYKIAKRCGIKVSDLIDF
jgi:transcriptional regulator with XRE-family HTH domain